MRWNSYNNWRAYVPVAKRRRKAARKVAGLKLGGRDVSPVEIEGRKIAVTFWGDAWCGNLEAYSDYSNRLPRGRTYVRRGSVIDLEIGRGHVHALVCGSELYEVDIEIERLARRQWADIKRQCAGRIDSLIELLQGSISSGVMEIVTCKGKGLFPAPREISFSCSCPDWASMCKHVAAALYGVGARLDRQPELLFTLRGVEPVEMLDAAASRPLPGGKGRKRKVLRSDELSSVFGVDIEDTSARIPPKRGGRAAPKGESKSKRAIGAARLAAGKRPSNTKTATAKSVAKNTRTQKSATTKCDRTKHRIGLPGNE
jgi:uncharacterized Zn finger protein